MKTQTHKTLKKVSVFSLLLTGFSAVVMPVSAMDILVKKNKNESPAVKSISLYEQKLKRINEQRKRNGNIKNDVKNTEKMHGSK